MVCRASAATLNGDGRPCPTKSFRSLSDWNTGTVIGEVCKLKRRCRSGFYEDVKKGLVKIEKIGRKSIIRGPVAKAYISAGPA